MIDYCEIARRIASLGLPTLIVMEGGYAIDDLGSNVTALLSGFELEIGDSGQSAS